MGVHAFLKGVYPKLYLIARQGFELAYFDIAVKHVSHCTKWTYLQEKKKYSLCDNRDEIVNYIQSECRSVQREEEYKNRNN